MVNIYIDKGINLGAATYTIKELFRYIDIDFNVVKDIAQANIIYTLEKMETTGDVVIINASKMFWINYLNEQSLPSSPLYRDINQTPFIYKDDFIASAFFMLTGYEEYLSDKRDRFDRFLHEYSIYKKDKIYSIPLVELYRSELISLLNKNNIKCDKKNIWNGSMGLFLTHDVDGVYKYRLTLPSLAKIILKPSKFSIRELAKSKLSIDNDPYYQGFYHIIEESKKAKLKSTFFFITNPTSKLDNFYNIGDKHIRKVIKNIEDVNFEIGLHGSLESYNNQEKFSLEHARLNKCYGGRQHYLKYELTETSQIHSNFLSYDSTLGFADMIGYRRGTCLPFKLFDLDSNSDIDLFEIPLLVMDQTLKSYMKLDENTAYEQIFKVIDQVEKHNGLFTFLWHPGNCSDEWESWFCHVYKRVIKLLQEKKCESLLGHEIITRISN